MEFQYNIDHSLLSFIKSLPKVELHAHLNGSLSNATMLKLQRLNADSGLCDNRDPFLDEFQIASGDSRTLIDCFRVFDIAHALTNTPKALELATHLTLKEFEEDGCCYIELRSTPRDTKYMSKKQYVDTIIKAMRNSTATMKIIPRLIISIDRKSTAAVSDEITCIAIEAKKAHPDIVVGMELSGNPMVGNFQDFVPALNKAKNAGLKITLHCGEVSSPLEVMKMLNFRPDRIGHGTCIHPDYSGTNETWATLLQYRIPTEICLTSNVNTKSTNSYESHHFKRFYDADLPLVLCTDDKGVFNTSLSQEYAICAETFNLSKTQLYKLSLNAIDYIFDEKVIDEVKNRMEHFMRQYSI